MKRRRVNKVNKKKGRKKRRRKRRNMYRINYESTDIKFTYNGVKNMLKLLSYRGCCLYDFHKEIDLRNITESLINKYFTLEYFRKKYVSKDEKGKDVVKYKDLSFISILSETFKEDKETKTCSCSVVPILFLNNDVMTMAKLTDFLFDVYQIAKGKVKEVKSINVKPIPRIIIIFNEKVVKNYGGVIKNELKSYHNTNMSKYLRKLHWKIRMILKLIMNKTKVDVFSLSELNVFGTNYFDTKTKHHIIHSSEINNIKYNLNMNDIKINLLKVKKKDPIVRYMGAGIDNIIKFYSNSETSGKKFTYRIVIE